MKFRYKPYYGDEVSFDPATELVCPLCGVVKPAPIGFKVQNSFVTCQSDKPSHPGICFDINALTGMGEVGQWNYMIDAGIIHAEDLQEWLKKVSLWHFMDAINPGGVKWKAEPEPHWRARIAREIAERDAIAV